MKASEQKKHDYNYKREDLYTCIVFLITQNGTKKDGYQSLCCLKYHKVLVDKPRALDDFKKHILKNFPNAKYFNVYGGISGDYYKRIYLP